MIRLRLLEAVRPGDGIIVGSDGRSLWRWRPRFGRQPDYFAGDDLGIGDTVELVGGQLGTLQRTRRIGEP
jgi:hypothetical protein